MNLNKPELARLYYRELVKIHEQPAWPAGAKAAALAHLLELLFLEATKTEKIAFTTLFARIAYACHKCQVEKKTQYWIHFFRKKTRETVPEAEADKVCVLGLKVLADAIAGLFGEPPPAEVQRFLPTKIPFAYAAVKVEEFRQTMRVIALQDDEANDRLLARPEDDPAELVYVQYNIAERNEPFNPTIRAIRKSFGFPLTLSLIDVEIVAAPPGTEAKCLRPRAIVVEPDFLVDVTAIANCFQGSKAEPVLYLLQKFLPNDLSVPMLVGNVANFFLDELMHNPQATFQDTFPKIFKLNPLTFALLPDAAILEIRNTSQKHWATLKDLVMNGLNKESIDREHCYLEPSFYTEKYGLQGRLDVFYNQENRSAIIELKSGKPFMPNQHGVGASHFIQTLLYDLMVRTVIGEGVEPACYILYSGLETGQLRFAPLVKAEQNEALQLRNQLVAIERHLAALQGKAGEPSLLQKLVPSRFPHLKGYHQQNLELFGKTYLALTDLERAYFDAFTGFIAREHQLAKTGVQGAEGVNGLASLWLDSPEEKEANFQIIKSLRIKLNKANGHEPLLVFEKTEATNPLANFRSGDIAVLYPVKEQQAAAQRIATQIFKVTILSITPDEVTVRLRYRQFNLQFFTAYEYWNLEHDQMDMGFTGMYQGLFQFAQSHPSQRQLLLALRAPCRSTDPSPDKEADVENLTQSAIPVAPAAGDATSGTAAGLTAEQHRILQKMLSAQEYFLLWGPPGTGKTNQMLRHYARWVFENTTENLLLLAYTNRAVDEICEALEAASNEVGRAYLRIGSRYATSERFQHKLLDKKIEAVTRRSELLEVLNGHRIFVATLASLSGNQELLKLKKFRRVVIDEASQILEPVLVGLLPQFEQFILIGDHKQLPAVVVQDADASAVADPQLQAIGLQNLRNSLFERLYRRCLEQGWQWAFDHLSHQGRMHADIMRFPNEFFYENKLQILPPHIPLAQRQLKALPFPANAGPLHADWEMLVRQQRVVFLSTPVDTQGASLKTNRHEAQLIAALVKFFRNASAGTEVNQGAHSIGIITPYRAQIAQIQDALQQEGIDCHNLTIDTVERYQGGTRDVILISLCVNAIRQMDTLVSLSEEGVDRKLNVALTRAREHVVIVGNEAVLKRNPVYSALIDFCRRQPGTAGR